MKAVLIITAALALNVGMAGAEPGKPVALLDQVPYRDGGMGSRKIVDEKHVLMMQVAEENGGYRRRSGRRAGDEGRTGA